MEREQLVVVGRRRDHHHLLQILRHCHTLDSQTLLHVGQVYLSSFCKKMEDWEFLPCWDKTAVLVKPGICCLYQGKFFGNECIRSS